MFFTLAQELAAQGNRQTGAEQEVWLRAAVGRAYYAAFLIARDKTSLNRERHDIHRRVYDAVKGRRNYGAIADKLFKLRMLRTSADYDMILTDREYENWVLNWIHAESIIKDILPRLESL